MKNVLYVVATLAVLVTLSACLAWAGLAFMGFLP